MLAAIINKLQNSQHTGLIYFSVRSQANDPIRLAVVADYRVGCRPWILCCGSLNEKRFPLTYVLEPMMSRCWHCMAVSVAHVGVKIAAGSKLLEVGFDSLQPDLTSCPPSLLPECGWKFHQPASCSCLSDFRPISLLVAMSLCHDRQQLSGSISQSKCFLFKVTFYL